ncbi:MAG TPA: SpoIIE family protein phosphatase [Opitutaceae bacterium]|nr:SpoIIE family protein phosphatase [Opitutaceae bacterium]
MSDSPAASASHQGATESLDSAILRLLMDTIPDRIYFKDEQSRIVRNNAAHARSLGAASPEECVGKTDADFFSREHADLAYRDEQEIIRTGRPVIAKIESLTMRDGRHTWASTTKMPWRDAAGKIIGTFGLTRDVSAAKEAEDKLTEERNLLRTIIDHLPSRLYVKDAEARYVLNNPSHIEMLGAASQAEVTGRTTLDFFPGERGKQALADDQQVLSGGAPIINHEKSDFGAAGNAQWSLVTKVPLRDLQNRIVGLVGISHDITERKRTEQELQRRTTEMETDLRMARQVQEAFLMRAHPVFPRSAAPGESALRFAYRYIPATTLGGDFFDIIQLSDTRCGVLVCDVMGHGVRAGLLTGLVRGVVEEMGQRATDPVHVLMEVNRCLMPIVEQTGQPVFATAFFAMIDTAKHTICYGNAGHPAPLILRGQSANIVRLAPADPEPAAGLLRDFAYTGHECEFGPGDLLLGYTDGVLEASDAEGRLLGEEGIARMLTRSRGKSSADVCDLILREMESHSGRKEFEDDVCLVAIEAA